MTARLPTTKASTDGPALPASAIPPGDQVRVPADQPNRAPLAFVILIELAFNMTRLGSLTWTHAALYLDKLVWPESCTVHSGSILYFVVTIAQ